MAPRYDSDSSGGEEEEFTETNVLLGYASKDADDDTISRLGGQPEWIDPETPGSASLARCKVCKGLMPLLLQLNAELHDNFPGHERRLYVFGCRNKTCRRREGSIRAVRGIRAAPGSDEKNKKEKPKVEKKPPPPVPETRPPPPTNLGETLFGSKGMGSSGGGGGSINPFSAVKVDIPTGQQPKNPFSAPAPTKIINPPETPTIVDPKSAFDKTEKDAQDLPKSFAETLTLNNPQQQQQQATAGAPAAAASAPAFEPWPVDADHLPRAYPVSYLADAEYETLDPTPPPVAQQTTQMDIDSVEDDKGGKSGGAGGGKEDAKVFESSMDADFQKFADRMAQNPEQCIRYEFGGTPLLYSKTDAVGRLLLPPQTSSSSSSGSIDAALTAAAAPSSSSSSAATGTRGIPRCANCGAPRAFEVQMTPNAIAELEAEELSLDDGMDWGTVMVGCCVRDCRPAGVGEGGGGGYLEEWCGVQWEEVGKGR